MYWALCSLHSAVLSVQCLVQCSVFSSVFSVLFCVYCKTECLLCGRGLPGFQVSGRRGAAEWTCYLSGQWTVDSGQWTVDSGQWTMDSGQWTVDSGQWTVDSEQWTVDSGQWTVDSGQWTVSFLHRSVAHLQALVQSQDTRFPPSSQWWCTGTGGGVDSVCHVWV